MNSKDAPSASCINVLSLTGVGADANKRAAHQNFLFAYMGSNLALNPLPCAFAAEPQ